MKADKIEALIAPVVSGAGYELVDIDYKFGKETSRLQIFIDRAQGVNLDDLTSINRRIGEVLDSEDLVHGSYSLEVSSPGIERPLKRLVDFNRFKGKRVRVNLYKPINGGKSFLFRIKEVREDTISFLDDSETELSLRFCEIAKANLYFDFDNK